MGANPRPIDPNTGTYVERRQRTGTIADRRDFSDVGHKKWARRLNIAFVISASLALIGPAIISSYFGISLHVITSQSMNPAIQAGDMAVAKVARVDQVHDGDVVMMLNTETWQMQAHRVIDVENNNGVVLITTKGDANNVADKPVQLGMSAPIRVVLYPIPKLGYVANALNTKTAKTIGLVALIGINILIASNVLLKRRKTDRKRLNLMPETDMKEIEKEARDTHNV